MLLIGSICLFLLAAVELSLGKVILQNIPVAENNSVMEVRSVLIRCPNSPVIANPDKKYVPAARMFDIIKFYDIDRDEPLHYNRVDNCKRKLVVTIQFYNSGQVVEKEEVILVRRVYDPVVHQFCGLLKPMIIKLKQQQMRQAFHLNYVREVNGKPYEDVLNKGRANFTGCVYSTKKPTCGLSYKGGVYIPYSEGFCCSCDIYENLRRQPETFMSRGRTPEPYSRIIGMYPDMNHPLRNKEMLKLEGPVTQENSKCKECSKPKRSVEASDEEEARRKTNATSGTKVKFQEDNCPTPLDKGPWELGKHVRVKRQYTLNGRQVRGGQSCVDHFVPSKADPLTYHDSAHCLRYSDLWYKIYALSPPFVERRMSIQLFEKYFKESGYSFWKRRLISKGISVGSLKMEAYNPEKTISFKYVPLSNVNESFISLNFSNGYILIPRGKSKMYPKISGDPMEFMLVSPDQITDDGTSCDKIGVNHNAFYHQQDRCGQQKGTCLKNQPYDLWEHDMEMRSEGTTSGSYFLENYSKDPIIYSVSKTNVNDTYFTMDYYGPYKDAIEIEVNADSNYALRLGSSAQISEIHIDCTAEEITNVTILVLNRGLVSSRYRTKFTNCPEGVPIPWSSTIGPLVSIAPQKAHSFKVSLLGPRPINRFFCTVEVQNSIGEIVARRRMKFQHLDRCICMWHCLCACLGSSAGLNCSPMSVEHYHAAGFLGDLPYKTDLVKECEYHSKYRSILKVFYAVLLELFILGLLKGLIGLCFRRVASYWLWACLPYSSIFLRAYYSCNCDCRIVRNQYGFALHPITRSRNIQLTSRCCEFIINCLFFLMLPGVILLYLIGHVLALIEESINRKKKSEGVVTCVSKKKTYHDQSADVGPSISTAESKTTMAYSSQTPSEDIKSTTE